MQATPIHFMTVREQADLLAFLDSLSSEPVSVGSEKPPAAPCIP